MTYARSASDLPACSCIKMTVVHLIAAFVLGWTPELAFRAMSLPDPDLVKANLSSSQLDVSEAVICSQD